MPSDYPTFTENSHKGELGVQEVSSIIFSQYKWIFRRTPQEFDFGIDAHIDVVTPERSVTGQQIAVQIKYGESYFSEENKWGFVYRGESKHLNYLENYQLPVLVLLVDPATNAIFWIDFDLHKIETTPGGNWKITIPKNNELYNSKTRIENLLQPIEEIDEKLNYYQEFVKNVRESNATSYWIDRAEVERKDTSGPVEFFKRLRATQETANNSVGKIDLAIDGYNEDERELWEIPEVREYIGMLDKELADILFFASIAHPPFTLTTFVYCTSDTKRGDSIDGQLEILCDMKGIINFLDRHKDEFNRLNNWINRDYKECKAHYRSILDSFNMLEDMQDDKIEELLVHLTKEA